jgi:hypothetical protein
METKNCGFQYGTGDGNILADVSDLTHEAAMEMFNIHRTRFRHDLIAGKEPEMVVWVNMSDATSFGDTAKRWHSADFIVSEGAMYQRMT